MKICIIIFGLTLLMIKEISCRKYLRPSPTDMPYSQRDALNEKTSLKSYLESLRSLKVLPAGQLKNGSFADLRVGDEKITIPLAKSCLKDIRKIHLDQDKLNRYIDILNMEIDRTPSTIDLDVSKIMDYVRLLDAMPKQDHRPDLISRSRIKIMKGRANKIQDNNKDILKRDDSGPDEQPLSQDIEQGSVGSDEDTAEELNKVCPECSDYSYYGDQRDSEGVNEFNEPGSMYEDLIVNKRDSESTENINTVQPIPNSIVRSPGEVIKISSQAMLATFIPAGGTGVIGTPEPKNTSGSKEIKQNTNDAKYSEMSQETQQQLQGGSIKQVIKDTVKSSKIANKVVISPVSVHSEVVTSGIDSKIISGVAQEQSNKILSTVQTGQQKQNVPLSFTNIPVKQEDKTAVNNNQKPPELMLIPSNLDPYNLSFALPNQNMMQLHTPASNKFEGSTQLIMTPVKKIMSNFLSGSYGESDFSIAKSISEYNSNSNIPSKHQVFQLKPKDEIVIDLRGCMMDSNLVGGHRLPTKPAKMYSGYYMSKLKKFDNYNGEGDLHNFFKKPLSTAFGTKDNEISKIINVNLEHLHFDKTALFKIIGKALKVDEDMKQRFAPPKWLLNKYDEMLQASHRGQNIVQESFFEKDNRCPVYPRGMMIKENLKMDDQETLNKNRNFPFNKVNMKDNNKIDGANPNSNSQTPT